jgi:methanogenic corrinoid protein MtbC1
VSVDAPVLAKRARESEADFIALSTYNGVALDYLKRLREEMNRQQLRIPVFIGGKLNQITIASADSMPVDVSAELEALGAHACRRIEDMLQILAVMATEKGSSI